jgi:hypothetical protein
MKYYQYIYYTDPTTLLKIREGACEDTFVIDAELTDLGFNGTESTNIGISGDWINIEKLFKW